MRFGPLPHSLHLDPRYLALQQLTRYRFFLVHSLAREKVYAAQVALVLKMNTYQAGEPFSDVCQERPVGAHHLRHRR
jgi:transposase